MKVASDRLPQAIGSTAYQKVKEPLKRMREGKLSEPELRLLYSGKIRNGYLEGKVKHSGQHGQTRRTSRDYERTLSEL